MLGHPAGTLGERTRTAMEDAWMKAYLITTGTLFGLIVLAHIWRLFEEGAHPMHDPSFVLFTFAAAVLSVWAWGLLARPARHGQG